MVRRFSVAAALVFAAAGCGGSHEARLPGLQQCVAAWNANDNAARRALVAGTVLTAGYTRPGIQIEGPSFGLPISAPDPGVIGCRVLFTRRDRWVAYFARRDGDRFRFATHLARGWDVDDRGVWSQASFRGPRNARLVGSGRIELRS